MSSPPGQTDTITAVITRRGEQQWQEGLPTERREASPNGEAGSSLSGFQRAVCVCVCVCDCACLSLITLVKKMPQAS